MYMQVWNFTDFRVLIAVSSFYPLAIVYMNFSRLQCNVFSASTCDVLVFYNILEVLNSQLHLFDRRWWSVNCGRLCEKFHWSVNCDRMCDLCLWS